MSLQSPQLTILPDPSRERLIVPRKVAARTRFAGAIALSDLHLSIKRPGLSEAVLRMLRAMPGCVEPVVRDAGSCVIGATDSSGLSLGGDGAGLVVAADCRLDDRHALLARLDLSQFAEISDRELLAKAYRKWGSDFPRQLTGAFACVFWDEARRKFLWARDHMGARTLYYAQWQGLLLFASEPHGVLGFPDFPKRLDRRTVALSCVQRSMSGQDAYRTYFEGISCAPSATVREISATGIHEQPYWAPDIDARLSIPDREVPEALREILFNAVADRLPRRGRAASLLSGGLDSSTLTAIAATLLRQQNRQLIALSAVNADGANNQFADEREFIDEFSGWDNVVRINITAPGRGPFDDVDQLVRRSATPEMTSRHYLYGAFVDELKGRGCDSILDGVGGELGPTFHGEGYFPELLLHGRLWTLGRELILRGVRDGRSLHRVILSDLVRPLLPLSMLRLIDRRQRLRMEMQFRSDPIRKEFMDAYLQTGKNVPDQTSRDWFRPLYNHRLYQVQGINFYRADASAYQSWPSDDAVTPEFPFFDRRVLEFCLAAPGSWKVRDGYKRCLIRTAMQGLLPAKIQWRTTKEPFSPDFQLRYNSQRPKILEMFKLISPEDSVREIVDVDALVRLASLPMLTNRSGTMQDYSAMHMVPQGVYLLAFLRQFPEFCT